MLRVDLFLSLLLLAMLLGCTQESGNTSPTGSSSSQLADAVYRGGPIVTVSNDQPLAEALAVKDGRILAVGAERDVMAHVGPSTELVDLDGKTLVPGFIDGHAHVGGFGLQAVGANLLAPPDGQVTTIEELVQVLTDWANSTDDDTRMGWVFGLGYDDAILAEGRHPTRDDLDRVSTDVPVIVIHISGHFAAVNSKGLEKIGYTADTPDPEGGVIRRREGSNEPNGVLEELAAIPVFIAELTPTKPEDAVYFLEKGLEMAMSFGYTTAQEGRAFAQNHDQLADYATSRGFPIDVVSYIDYATQAPLNTEWNGPAYRGGYRVGGMKLTLDGSPQGRTAWRTSPYLVPPDGQGPDYSGYPAIPDQERVDEIVGTAYKHGWQLLTHANGDAAIDQLIQAHRGALETYGSGDRRHVLIHGQYVRPDQLDSLAELDLVASLFPMHTFYWGDWHAQIIGDELAENISPTRSALDRGLLVTSHTDAPVALPNLMQIMWATVNRVTRSGRVLGAEQRLTPEEALRAITIWGARQHFEEDEKGSLEVGKLADLVILSDNPLTIDPMKINEIVVLETIKYGKTVWSRPLAN